MNLQNIFDNETFFSGYKALRDSDCNANDLIEQPAMRKLLPDLNGKSVLDLGCGYGHNCIDFVNRGADKVVGIDISEKMLSVAEKESHDDKIEYRNMSMTDISQLKGKALRKARKDFQMVFQDPYGSLNPRLSIRSTLEEVLVLHTALDKAGRLERMKELMQMVGLNPEQLNRYPHEFSGGQRQRIGIARALAAEPKLLIADEPVSALDVSVQASIINLLQELQEKTNIGLLFIAHDLAVVEHISDRILVMYLGRIVESAPAGELCSKPLHPYTAALLSAVPSLEKRSAERIKLAGDVPSPLAPPSGCAFHDRCAYATTECRTQRPELREIAPGRFSACFCVSENGDFSCEKQQ